MPKLLSCRAKSKGLFSVSESSRRVVQKSSSETRTHGLICHAGMQRMLVREGEDVYAWIIPETSDPAPHAVVAPVDEEIDRGEQPKLQRHPGLKRLKACGSSEKPVTLQQTV